MFFLTLLLLELDIPASVRVIGGCTLRSAWINPGNTFGPQLTGAGATLPAGTPAVYDLNISKQIVRRVRRAR